MFRTDDIHETGLARPHLLKFAPNLLGPWAEKLFVWPIALGLMGRNILQSLKETWPDKVLNFLVTFYKNLFQNLKDAACLIQFSFFMYVLDDEMNIQPYRCRNQRDLRTTMRCAFSSELRSPGRLAEARK